MIHGGTARNIVPEFCCRRRRGALALDAASSPRSCRRWSTRSRSPLRSRTARSTSRSRTSTAPTGCARATRSFDLASAGLRAAGFEPQGIAAGGGADANVFNAQGPSLREPRQRHDAHPQRRRVHRGRRPRGDGRGHARDPGRRAWLSPTRPSASTRAACSASGRAVARRRAGDRRARGRGRDRRGRRRRAPRARSAARARRSERTWSSCRRASPTTGRSRSPRPSASSARRPASTAGAGARARRSAPRLATAASASTSSSRRGWRRASLRRTTGEEIEVVRWTAGEVEARLGELEDSKTLIGALLVPTRTGLIPRFGRCARGIVSAPMRVGVVKEIKQDEYRVALTPAGARELQGEGPRRARRGRRRGGEHRSRTPSTRRSARSSCPPPRSGTPPTSCSR